VASGVATALLFVSVDAGLRVAGLQAAAKWHVAVAAAGRKSPAQVAGWYLDNSGAMRNRPDSASGVKRRRRPRRMVTVAWPGRTSMAYGRTP